VTTAAQLAAILDDYKVGGEVTVDVWREGKQMQLRAKLKAPESDSRRSRSAIL
jgi:S1-C subfamily serine protease